MLWNARPGIPIAAVFATEDGGAAVSIDESNHARLWPSLDGKREPWVVPLTTPVRVALVRDGDGFALAALDVSGGMELVTITAAGELTSRVKQPPEPGFDELIASDGGFLVLRRDQTLVQLDAKGIVRATLAPPPGEHVLKLVHRKEHTLAIVRTKDGIRGHRLASSAAMTASGAAMTASGSAMTTSGSATAGSLTWGDVTGKLTVDLKRVFLSPDGQRLITFSNFSGEPIMIDVESGRRQAFASPNIDAAIAAGTLGLPIGFAGDSRVVFAFNDFELSTLEWFTPSGRKTAIAGGTNYALEFVNVDGAVVTDKNVVAFSGHELAIATPNSAHAPSEVRFLGYRSPRAKAVKGSPLGAIATIGGRAYMLDERVHVATRVPALDTIPIAKDLALIRFTPKDGGEPVVSVSNGIDPEWLEGNRSRPKHKPGTPRVALFDLATKKDLQRWPSARAIRFEPASQLMAIDRGGKVVFARFDAAARKFVDERTVTAQITDVVLLDPTLADGNVAMLVRARGGTVETRTLRDVAAPLPEPVALTGTLEAIDRAGRTYVRADDDTIVVHRAGAETRITGLRGWKLRPSPTGAQIAALAKNRLMLLDERGESAWASAVLGVSDAAWTPRGELVVLAGDIATVDLADGSVIAAQCGWGFALRRYRPDAVDFPSTTETLCDR